MLNRIKMSCQVNFDDYLAEKLQSVPALWDKRSNDFRDKNKRKKAIAELAAFMKTTTDHVLARFKALREKYRKEKLRLAGKSGDGQIEYEPWHLMETLSFFDAVQVSRKLSETKLFHKKTNLLETPIPTETLSQDLSDFEDGFTQASVQVNEEEDQETVLIYIDDDPGVEKENEEVTSISPVDKLPSKQPKNSKNKGKKRKCTGDDSVPDDVVGLVNRLATAAEATANKLVNTPVTREDNHIDSFGKFVVANLKRLPQNLCDETIFDINDILRKKIALLN